jgi:hypothetical protein
MKTLGGLLIALSISLAGLIPAPAASLMSGAMRFTASQDIVVQAQSCADWRRTCAEAHGWRTYGWHQCMAQPGALADCGRQPRARCSDWQRTCAEMYGRRTQQWYACMGQPGAIRDCSS